LAAALLKVLSRALATTAEQRRAILDCKDPERLERWIVSAVKTSSAADLLARK
jgi:hypothetical protein